MLKKILRAFEPNPLDRIIQKAVKEGHKRFLIAWNRGLGDIALGLYAIVHRIREKIPDAHVTFLTRKNLEEGFVLLGDVDVLIAPDWQRSVQPSVEETLELLGVSPHSFDVIIEKPDPTYWVKWQLGNLIPKLKWNKEWDYLWRKFSLDPENEQYIGVHIQTETSYASWRNWPLSHWERLFALMPDDRKIILFGFEKKPLFSFPNVIDLRGGTNLYEALSIIKNCCEALIVPDSGISAMTYFLDTPFPIKLISLWADPNMGILKQNVQSPNPELQHIPLVGLNKNIKNIQPHDVHRALFS